VAQSVRWAPTPVVTIVDGDPEFEPKHYKKTGVKIVSK